MYIYKWLPPLHKVERLSMCVMPCCIYNTTEKAKHRQLQKHQGSIDQMAWGRFVRGVVVFGIIISVVGDQSKCAIAPYIDPADAKCFTSVQNI